MSTQPPDGHGDRRRHPRIDTQFQGSLACGGETQCRVLNISRSGAFAISNMPLPEMAQVEIRLQVGLPGEEPRSLQCEAAVVRCDRRPDGNYDVGLFFTSIDPEGSELLAQIIESQQVPSSI